jgi:hypothetical protein
MQNFSRRFFQINQGNPGGKFPAARYDGNGGFQHFVHNRSHSYRETLFWLGFPALAKEQKANPWVQKYHYQQCPDGPWGRAYRSLYSSSATKG